MLPHDTIHIFSHPTYQREGECEVVCLQCHQCCIQTHTHTHTHAHTHAHTHKHKHRQCHQCRRCCRVSEYHYTCYLMIPYTYSHTLHTNAKAIVKLSVCSVANAGGVVGCRNVFIYATSWYHTYTPWYHTHILTPYIYQIEGECEVACLQHWVWGSFD